MGCLKLDILERSVSSDTSELKQEYKKPELKIVHSKKRLSLEKSSSEPRSAYGARWYDPATARWSSVDPLAEKYVYESPYSYVGNNPLIHIDPDGLEKIVVIGNQGYSPKSDMTGPESNGRYRYGRYTRHFLQAGLDQARKYKSIAGDEQVTMVVYKGNYTPSELSKYRAAAFEDNIGFKVVESSKQVSNYVNAKDVKGDNIFDRLFGSNRSYDLITDFAYVGHGGIQALYTGYNAVRPDVDLDALYTSSFNAESFNLQCNIHLNACASGFGVMNDFVNRLTGGSVTGYRTTIIWGESGIGSWRPYEKFYYPPDDPRRNSNQRPIVPLQDRTRTEFGIRR